MFRCLGVSIVFLIANQQPSHAAEFTGEVIIVISKDGSSDAIQQAEIREIAGQRFVGGKLVVTGTTPDAGKVTGNRIWISVSEIARVIEYDTLAQLTGKTNPVEPTDVMARIVALGGNFGRDRNETGSPIVSVDLSSCTKLEDGDFELLSQLTTLRELHLHEAVIPAAGWKQIGKLKDLKYLGLIGVNVTNEGLKELEGLQALEEIRVGNTGISDAGLKELAKLKNLKMVGLIGTAVTDAGVKEFSEALPEMRHNLGPEGEGGGGGGQRSDPNFDVSIESPAYVDKHPSVLFDEAHQNFHTATGRYKTYADLMTNDGYKVVPNKEVLTPERLAGHDILIIANACAANETSKSAFTDAECDSIQNWVGDGGSLLLITDHEPFASASEELGKRFGVQMSLQVAVDPKNESNVGLQFVREAHQIGQHPITTGRNESERVNRVLTFTGQSLKGPDGSVPLLKFADTAKYSMDDRSAAGRSQGLALNFGKGRVVVMGEAAQLSAQVYGNPPEPMGMNVPGCDNRKLAINVMHWLSGILNSSTASKASPADSDSTPATAPTDTTNKDKSDKVREEQ
ncbi:leucine-rich repeat domain-containing protein [Schlesneria paludicola]|uniref:hypothetical protein n=1 Tax=Schlesneria paludicola TaxID=360056 RepID=UPI00029AC1EA|nr:hypothetical protein [Schlesneria paludicola]